MLSVALFIFVICLLGISAPNVRAATVTVTGIGDTIAADGQCTLREAIKAANTNAAVNECPAGDAGADTINFDTAGVFATPQTIILTSGELGIGSGLTILGPGSSLLTVRRDPLAGEFRIFTVGSGVTATLSGLRISGGKTISSPGYGGGILNHGTLTLNNCTVSDNTAYIGGGILSDYGGTVLTINNSLVSDNRANGYGGGVFSFDATILTINKSTVSGNQGLGGYGGGVVSAYGGLLTIDASTISNNYALYGGGGIHNGTTGVITNTTISGNSGNLGGGIFTNSATYLSIRFCTIVDNHGFVKGGGISKLSGGLDINSSIVAGNTAPITPEVNWQVTSGDYNLFGNTSGMGGLPGTHNITNVDPMLGPLQYNGGTTKTHALLPGSPAINAGSNTFALTTDQRTSGFDRVVGPTADIGAFEVQPACAGISFSPAANFAAGDVPVAIAKADLNGDGDTDLVVANYPSDEVTIFFGDGAGGFAPAAVYPTGEGPRGITVADFNGDTHVDLAVANQRSDSVSILLNNGNGTFAPHVVYSAGSGPTSIVHADYNGDGALDLATANYLSDDVSVLLGNGIGGFGPAASFSSTTRPVSLTTADFNSDGNPDLATANTTNSFVAVLLGNGAGGFASAFYTSVPGGTRWIASGDFNKDGRVDLAVASAIANVGILFQDAVGQFAYSHKGLGTSSDFVDVDDLNSDGNLDVVTVNSGSGTVLVSLGSGTGDFSAASSYPASDHPGAVVIGDFNRDGKPDLAVTRGLANSVDILLNSCSSNTAPVANNDSDSVNEDGMLNRPAPGLLLNDTDADGDTLTVMEVTPPTHGHLVLVSSGSFSYTPNANFNGVDSFTYKANDGSLDSNVATVTITVNAVNDAPQVSATPKTQPNVQYSDAIQTVTITASDIETPAANLSIAFAYTKNGGASVAGLPNGMSQGGTGGAWTVSGTAGVSAGTYVITASVTDSGDGTDAAKTSTDTLTIVVTRENAVAAPSLSNPVAMQVASAGGSASGTTGQICFDITEPSDGSAGDTSLINAATVQISAVGGGSAGSITPSAVTFSGGGVGGTRTACFTLTLAGTAPNVFEVTLNIGGDYYTGSGTTAFLVYDPSAGFASGGGWIINPNTGYRANYGVNVKYLKNGNAQGSILYIEHRPDGDYKFKSTSLNSSGGFAIVPITGGAEAQIAGKGNFGLNGVFTGNYSFIARVIDKGNPGTNDQFGLKLIAPNGQVMNEFTFNPVTLGGGNNQVPKK